MAIWFEQPTKDEAGKMQKGTLMETLDIQIIDLGEDYISGSMPVDHRTVQPYGILHGGASVALAETLGSLAAHLVVDSSKYFTVGMEVNANHLRPATKGRVTGTAKPIHIGKSSHVWGIEIKNDEGKMVCISRITMAIVSRDKIEK
jgi:1,4-dihydroxy-2-naphthoyl-CoA hydrolase